MLIYLFFGDGQGKKKKKKTFPADKYEGQDTTMCNKRSQPVTCPQTPVLFPIG